jgi:hypothetical protein
MATNDFDVLGVSGSIYDADKAREIRAVKLSATVDGDPLWIMSDKFVRGAELEKRRLMRSVMIALMGCAVLGSIAALSLGAAIGGSSR